MNFLASTQYGYWTPPLYTSHGGSIDRLIDVIHVFMIVIFVPWGLFFLYCLFNFRQRPGHRANYTPIKAKVSKYAEVAVAAFEAFLLLGMSMPVWADYKNAPPAADNRVEVRIVAEQFQWNFHHPGKDGKFGKTDSRLISPSNPLGLVEGDPDGADDIVLVNEVHLPVDKDVYVRLSTKDVIHSFSIPTFRVKQDVIPGMEIPIWFKIDKSATTDAVRSQMVKTYSVAALNWYKVRHLVASEDVKSSSGEVILAKGGDMGANLKAGTELIEKLIKAGQKDIKLEPRNPLELVCAQLCGNSHFKMKAQVITHNQADYDKWVVEAGKKQEIKMDF